VSFSPTQPGKVQGNSDYPTGSVMWIWNPTANNSDGTSGAWYPLEFDVATQAWGFWDSNFLGFGFLNTDLSQLEFTPGDSTGTALNTLLTNNSLNNQDMGQPSTIVLNTKSLESADNLPIDVAKRFIAGMLDLAGEGLDFLKGKAKKSFDSLNPIDDIFNAAVSLSIPKNPNNNYAPDIAGSIAANEVRTYENEDIPYEQKEKLIQNMNWLDIGTKIPITSQPTNYSDDNFYVNEKGDVTPHSGDSKEKYPPNTYDHQQDTYENNPLASAGEYHFELVVPEDGGEPYFNYEDHAYYNPNSTDKGEVPQQIQKLFANISQFAGKQLPGYPDGIKGDVVKKVKIPLSDAVKFNPSIKFSAALSGMFKESLDESIKLGHFDPEALTVDIEDIRKGIMPEFPKKPPAEMIDGYSVKSKLAPKVIKGEPTIKVRKKDLAALHILKDSEIKELLQQIDLINDYLQKNPADLIYAQQRYPKNDIRLAQLNWKMDQMLEAGEEYLDTQFPENQRLVDRIKKATKKTMELTNPEAYKNLNKPDMKLMSLDDHMKEKRVVSRYFKKKRQSKSMFRVNMEKVKEKNRKVAEQKVAEWQEKRRIELLNSNEFDQLKSDWKKELENS